MFNPSDIKNAILQGFKDFFCLNKDPSSFHLSSLDRFLLNLEEANDMTRQFSKEEIWIALQESDSRKAPGPDGINAGWIKKVWPHLSRKIVSYFNEFHDRAAIPIGANSSFIAPIPNKLNPVRLEDFRPISLINSFFKILLKVLANRLKVVLSKIIAEEQTAFIKGHNISESIFMVNEVIHTMKTQKTDG